MTAFTVIFFLIGAAFSYQIILPFVTDWLTKLLRADRSRSWSPCRTY